MALVKVCFRFASGLLEVMQIHLKSPQKLYSCQERRIPSKAEERRKALIYPFTYFSSFSFEFLVQVVVFEFEYLNFEQD